MQVICDHANTEHCKKVSKDSMINCHHSKPHEHSNNCNIKDECGIPFRYIIKVKCIPYQEESK